MLFPYLVGALLYFAAASLTYSSLRNSSYFLYIGIIFGALTNGLWFYIASKSEDKEALVKLALYWDVMIVAIYAIVPFIFFQIRLPPYAALGAVLMGAGIVLLKLG